MNNNVMLSGGAIGSDIFFGEVAKKFDHSVFHLHFKGHKSSALKTELIELTKEQLLIADQYLKNANLTLKRKFPTNNEFVNNLLRRNWYQIENSENVYAVSTLKNEQVQGGTAWATQMFIDRHDKNPCNCYVFCQNFDKWFKWQGFWQEIKQPQTPSGIWTGIGTRDLKENGKKAIESLFI
jgi:MoaA/NifB/PqqE/SkfB family radical SAM enzyme